MDRREILKVRCTPDLRRTVETAVALDGDTDSLSAWIRRTLRREAEMQQRVWGELEEA